jgi:hypothetical protein
MGNGHKSVILCAGLPLLNLSTQPSILIKICPTTDDDAFLKKIETSDLFAGCYKSVA